MEFKTLKVAVAKQFEKMAHHPLFRTGVQINDTLDAEGETVKEVGMWTTYLASFPPGTNPIFNTRTEHDCQCCKSFIRAVGNVVCVIDGELVSVWDLETSSKLDDGYRAVASALSKLVKSKPIVNPFLHFENTAGTGRTLFDKVLSDRTTVSSFDHFLINLPSKYVAHGVDIPSTLGKARSAQQVFKRALDEIKEEAVTTTLELIGQGVLYRGDQFSGVLTAFQQEQTKYKRVAEGLRENHVWMRCAELGAALLHLRNSSIGTLLQDLSDDMELEDAVKKFESVMAPTNYKRPTALVSKAQIAQAKQTIEALGLVSALERRYAVIEDINVNDILFANRSARKIMKANVFDDLASTVPVKSKSLDKVEDVPIERFIADILPRVSTMELMFEKRLLGNLVSLVAPVDPTAKRLFKWDNGFSWSYNGDAADAIKERVKLAGGAVEGALCCRLTWEYTDDLDLHMHEPAGGEHIYFAHRRSRDGGVLDVDANGMDGILRPDPVENIVYASKQKMRPGVYVLEVNNYCRRSDGRGFEVEIEFGRDFGGEVRYNFVYDKVLRTLETVQVAHIKCTPTGLEVVGSLPISTVSKQIWNIATHTFVPVNVLMLSPNHWGAGRATGSKHWFFMLEGCKNDGQARPYFNEFLTEELTAHRKVLEMVGSKTKTELSDRQLSGLGFSSTVRNSVLCKVTGSFSRVINLVF